MGAEHRSADQIKKTTQHGGHCWNKLLCIFVANELFEELFTVVLHNETYHICYVWADIWQHVAFEDIFYSWLWHGEAAHLKMGACAKIPWERILISWLSFWWLSLSSLYVIYMKINSFLTVIVHIYIYIYCSYLNIVVMHFLHSLCYYQVHGGYGAQYESKGSFVININPTFI